MGSYGRRISHPRRPSFSEARRISRQRHSPVLFRARRLPPWPGPECRRPHALLPPALHSTPAAASIIAHRRGRNKRAAAESDHRHVLHRPRAARPLASSPLPPVGLLAYEEATDPAGVPLPPASLQGPPRLHRLSPLSAGRRGVGGAAALGRPLHIQPLLCVSRSPTHLLAPMPAYNAAEQRPPSLHDATTVVPCVLMKELLLPKLQVIAASLPLPRQAEENLGDIKSLSNLLFLVFLCSDYQSLIIVLLTHLRILFISLPITFPCLIEPSIS
ncbi:hypothetical protein U9M48_040805 [Paspalum notatum var. saurae]|uniref:Uncharacterized protein n=1 Tax=Paspalum notatum var. saurae TaxID=547442 RepID=A0AAQ3UT44_PASNO